MASWEFAGAGGCHGWERLRPCMVLCSNCEYGLVCCRFRKENCARALCWRAAAEGCTMPQVSWSVVSAAKAGLQSREGGSSGCIRPSGMRLGTAPHESQGSIPLPGDGPCLLRCQPGTVEGQGEPSCPRQGAQPCPRLPQRELGLQLLVPAKGQDRGRRCWGSAGGLRPCCSSSPHPHTQGLWGRCWRVAALPTARGVLHVSPAAP